jgi:voltage-gated potassium channel Kch
VLAGRYLLSPLLRLVGKISERELFIVTGLFTVCVSAAVMQAIGVSPALGAFVAGVMLAESPYRHELEADIDPFRSILLGLFFLAVGMLLDVDVILSRPFFVAGLALALITVKIAVIYALGRCFGLQNKPSIIMAMLLSQGGEFAFVLFAAAQQALLIEPEAASLFGAVVTLSMATTPFLMIFAGKLAARKVKGDVALDDPALASQANVIIVGHGRFGQQVSQIMQAAGRSVTLIDINPQTIDLSGDFGFKVFYGDGTRVDLLKRAGGEDAQAIFFCIDDRYMTAESLMPVRETFSRTKLFVRAYGREQALLLMQDDGISIMRELFESSIRMSADALKYFGTDRAKIHDILLEFRRRDQSRLKEQFNSGDMHAGTRHSFGGDGSDDFPIADD